MYSNIQRNINLKEIRRISECVEPLISSFARGGHYGWGFPYHKQCFVDVLRIKNWGPPTITVMMMMMKENNTSRGNYISQKKKRRNFPSRAVLECELEFFDTRGLSWPGSLATARGNAGHGVLFFRVLANVSRALSN